MTAQGFRPWTDLVKLHPDVEAKTLTESLFAIDLGAIAENDPNVPVVYRDADAFFRATYLTSDLRKLLEEVLSSLCGKPGFNRWAIKVQAQIHSIGEHQHDRQSDAAIHDETAAPIVKTKPCQHQGTHRANGGSFGRCCDTGKD